MTFLIVLFLLYPKENLILGSFSAKNGILVCSRCAIAPNEGNTSQI